MREGVIYYWSATRGFGFLKDEEAPKGSGTFVHHRAFEEAGIPEPKIGENYRFDTRDRRGRQEAFNLRRIMS